MHWLEQGLRRELGRKDREALEKLQRGEITIAQGFEMLGHTKRASQLLEQECKLPELR